MQSYNLIIYKEGASYHFLREYEGGDGIPRVYSGNNSTVTCSCGRLVDYDYWVLIFQLMEAGLIPRDFKIECCNCYRINNHNKQGKHRKAYTKSFNLINEAYNVLSCNEEQSTLVKRISNDLFNIRNELGGLI